MKNVVASALRSTGQCMDALGRRFEVNPYVEILKPSTRAVKLGKIAPKLSASFVAPDATVIGDVTVGENSSIWYGAVLRGDDNKIVIGESVSVGDRVMIHVASENHGDKPTIIKNKAVVGSGAVLHGCTLEEECFVGEGAQVLDGAVVQKKAVVAAGAVVPMGKVVKSGQLWAGVPAKYLRDLSDVEMAAIVKRAEQDAELSTVHAQETAKTWQQIERDAYVHEQNEMRNESYYRPLNEKEISFKLGEIENHQVPGRIFDSRVSARDHQDPR